MANRKITQYTRVETHCSIGTGRESDRPVVTLASRLSRLVFFSRLRTATATRVATIQPSSSSAIAQIRLGKNRPSCPEAS